ncbi:MAG: GHKL domain-containing protein [Candidatus Omnitrophica bacterium]|nr:GHKL domain-containing protein [Candidatus Omnitrophota bacterium]MBU4488082.1 GHKL domain-containing protein [Candidatus Omnitrophota bacterium]MCG2705683.1 ATP-binding protein [Candidatus Omnitrophota bacterium]
MPNIKNALRELINKLYPPSKFSKRHADVVQKEKMAFLEMLASAINHEIANPLSIARGQCEAFVLSWKEGLYKDKSKEEIIEKNIRIMERVIQETDRISDITKRLTDFVKSGKVTKPQPVYVIEEIDEVLTFLNAEIKLSDIQIIKDIPLGLPPIRADKKHIQQIFFNVIKNAAQALQDTRRIEIRGWRDGARLVFEIKDTGSGIKKEDLDKIFAPFFTTKPNGTGLGLFIVKQLTEINKGGVGVNSKAGTGTSFVLRFPVSGE